MSVNFFSQNFKQFYCSILSIWMSVSLTLILLCNLGDHRLITASSVLFVLLIMTTISINVYHLLTKMTVEIKKHHLSLFKFIPILSIILFFICSASAILRQTCWLWKSNDATQTCKTKHPCQPILESYSYKKTIATCHTIIKSCPDAPNLKFI